MCVCVFFIVFIIAHIDNDDADVGGVDVVVIVGGGSAVTVFYSHVGLCVCSYMRTYMNARTRSHTVLWTPGTRERVRKIYIHI